MKSFIFIELTQNYNSESHSLKKLVYEGICENTFYDRTKKLQEM